MRQITVQLLTPVDSKALGRMTDAARLCFVKDYTPGQEFRDDLLQKLKAMDHLTPLEFLDLTFHLKGISRVAALQLVRHRTFSWMSSSHQYQLVKNFDYVIPESLEREALSEYKYSMERSFNTYQALEKLVGRDDARYALPGAARTDMLMKGNFRNLVHFLGQRTCKRNTPEVLLIAKKICNCLPIELVKYCGPPCLTGYCTQGSMNCGQAYTHIGELL